MQLLSDHRPRLSVAVVQFIALTGLPPYGLEWPLSLSFSEAFVAHAFFPRPVSSVSLQDDQGSAILEDAWHVDCPTAGLEWQEKPRREGKVFYQVGSANFGDYVLKSKGMVLVNFWSPWIEECRNMSSLMGDLQDLLDEQDTIFQVDWDQQRELVQELKILGVPTLLIFVCGNEVARYYGTMNKEDLRKCIVEAKKIDDSKTVRP